jgi:hypothetical protein
MTWCAIDAMSGLREMVDWRVTSCSSRTHISVSPVSPTRNWNLQLTASPWTVPTNQPSTSHGVFIDAPLPRIRPRRPAGAHADDVLSAHYA